MIFMTVGLLSLGCKVNMYETEYVKDELIKRGYEIKDFSDKCDIYIINTCTVTETADTKSSKMIRRAIKENPNACIVVMGCFIEANKEGLIDGIDIAVGNRDKKKIPDLIEEYFKTKKKIVDLYKGAPENFEDMSLNDFPGRTRAFIKIEDGCDNYCTYCIIPYVRGKVVSKPFYSVIREAEELVKHGYKEIVLTGIHTGAYGRDLGKKESFADLLKALCKIDGLERIRISSIDPIELNEDVLNVLRDEKKIVNHLHIPLQAGTDEVLTLMKRKYDLKFYEDKIKEIRKIRENIAITTDLIVGFPGETDELFNKSIEEVKKIGFAKIHVFPYSERHGTKSMELDGHLPGSIKKERSRKMLEVSKELEINYAKKFLGKTLSILVESVDSGVSFGHTENYLHVKVMKELKHNTFVNVKLESIDYPYVIGVTNE